MGASRRRSNSDWKRKATPPKIAETERITMGHSEKISAVQRQSTEKLKELADQMRKLEIVHREVEADRLELLRTHKLEVANLNQALLGRERDFSSRLITVQNQISELLHNSQTDANNRMSHQALMHSDEVLALRKEFENREKYLQSQFAVLQKIHME